MPYGYNNRNSYRGSSGYHPSSRGSRNFRKKRKINLIRLRNRAIIIGTGLLIFALIIVLLVNTFNCICASSSKNGSTIDTSTVQQKETAETGEEKNAETKQEDTKAVEFKEPKIKDTNKKSAGVVDSGLYIWNKACFEPFYGTNEKAEEYAQIMNYAKKTLGKNVNIYSAIIPNHTEIGLPARLKNTSKGITTNSQAEFIKTAYEEMNSGVVSINAYDKLSEHCNEYVYFNSDHHWTGLGAYYAYTAFTDATSQKALSLKDCNKNKVEGFEGSFTELTNKKLETDTVYFWSMPFDVTNTWTDLAGNENVAETMYYWYAEAGSHTYGVFLFGDNPIEHIVSKSKNVKNEKIAIVHESYGNAMVPYFTDNYKEVYSIDFRYWSGNLKSFCKKNGITNVLFVNGVMSAATEDSLVQLKKKIG